MDRQELEAMQTTELMELYRDTFGWNLNITLMLEEESRALMIDALVSGTPATQVAVPKYAIR